MAKLDITLSSCVRVSSKKSTCTSCADVCPQDSITFDVSGISLAKSCDDCALCIGVCPTEAISIDGLDPIENSFSFLKSDKYILSCQDGPCIGIYHVEYLLSMAIMQDKEELELECCALCYDLTLQKMHEVNLILKKLKLLKNLKVSLGKEDKEDKEELGGRRGFLKKLTLQEPLDSTKVFGDLVGKDIKQKILPNKRKLLFMALKRVGKVDVFEDISAQSISFTSKKIIDDSCDNCSICYRVCPSGALSSNTNGSKIDFDSGLCLKCHLCHDVCESDSIKLDIFNTKDMLEPKVERLIEFKIQRCEDCGIIFTPKGAENMCRRCTIEYEESRSLWGI